MRRDDAVRIATYNINDINKRFDNLLALARAETEPDVVCLQELKADQHNFPAEVLRTIRLRRGRGRGERSWNGVAILARGAAPIVTRTSLPGDPTDRQARYIEAAVDGVLIASLYAPNGNPAPGPKFAYKLAWHERLIAHAADLAGTGAPIVLAGDYNVVPTVADVYSERSLQGNALIQPESREAFHRLLEQGWADALRQTHPEGPLWTFWSYLRNRRAADKGMRLDHLLLSQVSRGA